MFASMHDRIGLIATEDSDREQEIGARCPSHLKIILVTGHVFDNLRLIDGLNSHDDETFDVIEAHHDHPGGGVSWTIVSAHVVAIEQAFPTEDEIVAAKLKN
ncbi:hypothetical protein [Sphingomonas sp.]|jgi:hypothetical protein|uniref:hypothetical protein n=1 Tax=Sphingomonas sp. TaxID=28214 RepID=UPI002EDADA11